MSQEPWVPTTQKGVFANGVAWLIGILVVVGAVAAIIFVVDWATAPAKGKLEARKAIQSGAFRLEAYNHFFDLCASIQGLEGQLEAQIAEAQTATGDDLQRVEANIAGIQGERSQAVAEYNADARKSYTLGQFRASALPFQIPANYSKGEHTSCVAAA